MSKGQGHMEKSGKRRAVLLVIAALSASLASSAAVAEKIVAIGFAGPLSGLSAAIGTSMLNAAKMAVDDVNRANLRVNGEKLTLKLLVQDDKSNPRIADIVAHYFVKSGAVGVVGIF